MSDYSRLRDEQFYGDEGHVIMSSDVPDALIHDVNTLDEALRRYEKARWDAYLDQVEDITIDDPPVVDPFDDGDED